MGHSKPAKRLQFDCSIQNTLRNKLSDADARMYARLMRQSGTCANIHVYDSFTSLRPPNNSPVRVLPSTLPNYVPP